jgi:glutathione S-transferase
MEDGILYAHYAVEGFLAGQAISTTSVKLFYYPGACSLIPHIALEEVGAGYEAITVDFARDEQLSAQYLAINPAGQVPALQTEQGVITQIPAILAYLALTYPASNLGPVADPFEFANMQSFQMYIATTIHVLFRQISRPEAFAEGDVAQAALKARVPAMSDHYFEIIEQQMADGRPWVHGESYSASDIYLFVFSSYLNIGDRGDPGKIPAIWSHRQRVRARPAVERALKQESSGLVPLSLFDCP